MIKVDQYEYIRTSVRVYKKKIREVAKETGHSRNTIRKALKEEYIGYKPRVNQPYPVLGPYIGIIDGWIKDDKDKPKKQRHTATRVYHRLQREHDYQGGETTVRRYVREAKLRYGLTGAGVFIPCSARVGQEAEIDWGACIAILGGVQVKLKMFCMRSKFSGKHYVRCYPCERQQSFFDAHIRAFEYFGGIFPVLIYDNLTTAVQKVFVGKKRKLQESYNKFKAYYNFEPRFCNVGKGNEKGGVEGLVGYSRRNYMVPVPCEESLAALNEKLLHECYEYGDHRIAGQQETVSELYGAEKEHLIKLPETEFGNVEPCKAKADKYATISVDRNRYSVPVRYANMILNVLQYTDRIDLFWRNWKITSHQRLYGINKWNLNPQHYLRLIQHRPQSFEYARPILQWREQWPECLERLLAHFRQKQGTTKGTRDFLSVLMLYKKHKANDVQTAVEKALAANVGCSRSVEHILLNLCKEPDVCFDKLADWPSLSAPDVSVYNQIGGEI